MLEPALAVPKGAVVLKMGHTGVFSRNVAVNSGHEGVLGHVLMGVLHQLDA